MLDAVLEAYVELDRSKEELAARGFDEEIVARVVAMVDRAEYKRRQAPPGVKLRPKAFGRDRRMPITNRWAAEQLAERAERVEPLLPGDGGVRGRRGGQHVEQRVAQAPLLEPELRTLAIRPFVGGLPDERDGPWP